MQGHADVARERTAGSQQEELGITVSFCVQDLGSRVMAFEG